MESHYNKKLILLLTTFVRSNMLPTELLLLIAEVDAQSFATIRCVDRNVRDYTNKYMDKYKEIFATEVKIELKGGYKEKYWELPNGDKNGLYQKFYPNGKLRKQCTYVERKRDYIKYGMTMEDIL